MNAKNILILGAVAVGGWWLWAKSRKTTTGTPDGEPQKEIAPQPQTTSPNVLPSKTETTNPSVKPVNPMALSIKPLTNPLAPKPVNPMASATNPLKPNTLIKPFANPMKNPLANNFLDFDGEPDFN